MVNGSVRSYRLTPKSFISYRKFKTNVLINTHVPDYEDEDFSDYGVYPVPKTVDPHSSVIRFKEGEFVTFLTQAIHPRVVDSMVLNVFVYTTGLEVGSFFDTSAPSICHVDNWYRY